MLCMGSADSVWQLSNGIPFSTSVLGWLTRSRSRFRWRNMGLKLLVCLARSVFFFLDLLRSSHAIRGRFNDLGCYHIGDWVHVDRAGDYLALVGHGICVVLLVYDSTIGPVCISLFSDMPSS